MMAEGAVVPTLKSEDDSYRYMPQDYPASFMKTLSQLRQDSVYCDIQLRVGTETFPCHRVILMAGSLYFHAMFSSEMTEQGKEVIDIGGVTSQIFAQLLDFIYSGEIEVTSDNCQDLLAAADMLTIPGVVDACCSFLKDRLQPDNCIGVYTFSDNISCDVLTKNAKVYIYKHFLKVAREEEFYSIPKDVLIHFLKSENLRIENEFQVFQAAMDWLLHNPTERRKHVFDVMKPVRFPIIPEKQMDKYLWSLADIDQSLFVALQTILTDFHSDKKSVAGRLFSAASQIKPHLTVPRKCARKNIYIIGGFTRHKGGRWSDAITLNLVERYDTFYKTWHSMPSFQFNRSACGAGVINGQVCVVGGENDSLIFDSVETYDPVSHEWMLLPGMTTPRCGLGVCTMDNYLYALGGWVGSEIGSTIEKYDPTDNCWSVIGHCRKLKCWMGLAAGHGLIYVVGGSNDLSEELSSVESFNPITKEWVTLPDLITNRSYTGVTILDDHLYAVGGWNERDGALNSVERLNCITTVQWTEVSPMSCVRAAACVVTVNNMLYVLGGRSYMDEFTAPSTLDSIECYDPHTDTWTDVGCMPTSRCEAAAVVI